MSVTVSGGSNHRFRRSSFHVVLAICLCSSAIAASQANDGDLSVIVVGTEFRITRADGSVVSQSELIGAVLTVGDAQGSELTFRIDSMEPDPEDSTGEVILYAFSARDPASGAWREMCGPDAEGVAKGFPLSGVWTADGAHRRSELSFNLTCTNGAIGKCVRMGYKPWKTTADGTSLWDYHQACVRMIRADYCGDGSAYTRDGISINVYDPLGIQVADPGSKGTFEAAWGADGAICVRKVRVPENIDLQSLERFCPDRLKGKVGENCDAKKALLNPATLILNMSN